MTKTKTARIENPYFVRVEFYNPPADVFDCGCTFTKVKAFETKREAWEYVKEVQDKYSPEYGDGCIRWESIKVQRNWKTLWSC